MRRFATVIVPFSELERVERITGWKRASLTPILRFKTSNPDTNGIGFTSFPSRMRLLEAKLENLGIPVVGAD
jgi:hypothetical protein